MIAVALMAVPGGAAARAQGSADLKTFDFMLGEVQYRILLPQRAQLMGRRVSDRFQVSLSTRMMRQMELQPAPGEGGKAYPRSQTLANGAVLTFEIIRDTSGYAGSGGPEETLEGRLQVGGRTLAVKCHDQAEWPGSPSPSWCLDYLQHLAVIAGG
jgi:hypothetical protein